MPWSGGWCPLYGLKSSHDKTVVSMIDYQKELDKLQQADSLRSLPTTDTSGLVNLSTNDYLGLNDRAELYDEFLGSYSPSTRSMSAASSRLLTGNHAEYQHFEETLSELYGGLSALVFNCGFHANTGVLPALADKEDLIIADKLIHASLIDGMRLAAANGTQTARFNHNDVAHLRRLLEKRPGASGRTFVVVESIYSMDGDMAPLADLCDLRREFGFMLYVDEAHGVGVRGKRGEGLVGELGLLGDVDVIVGTCGKALASEGAWVISSPVIRQWLVNKCRTMIFTTGLPPVNVAWTDFIVQKVASMEVERQNLRKLGAWLTNQLGMTEQTGGVTQIVPYLCGENSVAVNLSAALRNAGFYVLPIRHPTVPLGQARLRFSLKATMRQEDLSPMLSIINDFKR